ncbi:TlpA family protein disulfide reductase [Pseudotenacibaculum haliotis]|uniref:TlpA family protein disulfide reductase n=1 Tax=Pseudotenacibaculum haliotis TaxID=1862138 RepID=A0ABW5LQ00_9FLAO
MIKRLTLLSILFSIYSYGHSQQKIPLDAYTFNTVEKTKEKVVLTKSKQYILDFWYLECLPCVKDHKLIEKNIKSLKKKKIEVIGMSIDKNKEKWISYLKKHNYSWKNYNQYKGTPNLKEDLKIKMFPRYFLIDDKGNIKKTTNSFTKLLTYVNTGK